MSYQRTRIKICGLTSPDDALAAVRLGADALGFIFVRESPRRVEPDAVEKISRRLPPLVSRVGVFKDQDPEWICRVVDQCSLHIVQLHGQESPEYCESLGLEFIKAFRIKDEGSLQPLGSYHHLASRKAFLLDTFVPGKAGGTGKTFDWHLAQMASEFAPIILSGGINPENVGEAIDRVRPFAVDVSSGIETAPGKKDPERMEAFINKVYHADGRRRHNA
ncbi:MAG: phosphoribosylanthranilate isomerase [bacterium]